MVTTNCVDCGITITTPRGPAVARCNRCFDIQLEIEASKNQTTKNCRHCESGYVPHRVDGIWSHGLPGGRYLCTNPEIQRHDKLKVFQVLIKWPNVGRMPNIEMTLLDVNGKEVGYTVRGILEADGYDVGEAIMNVNEIEGPFDAGFVLARNGG